ncbi:subunit SecY of preprotein translocase [Hamiltosporidium magnivora]|uniref:Subunit SecY of preprotein translocase n=3 Tax=Hamiltosporidium magnivora TaxID=148818 RepID=A0A4Q9KSY9_9MICR|nr:subunit SecY of preprotein translocase [Hamiltosporidium magnivora]
MSSDTSDPLYWMRMMMASNKGTLMDLGISPVVTTSMVLQMLTHSDLLKVNYSVKEDRILFNASQKLISLIMTVGQAVVQVTTGFYGNPSSIGIPTCFLLVVQLIFSGVIVILLDELLQKGYGLGSGVNLFIATNVCESILWKAFSPKVFTTARGIEFEGSLIAFLHLIFIRRNKMAGFYEILFRKNLPNLSSLFGTIFIFGLVIYLQGLRVELPTESTQVKGVTGKWPIKLLYSSTMPVILQSYLVSHTSTISRFLYDKFPNFLLVRILGVWSVNENRRYVPINGLCSFIYPPESFTEALKKPLHFLIYLSFMLLSAAFFSRTWIDVSESNQFDVAKQLKRNKMTLKGVREKNVPEVLGKYIPTAAFLGGFFIGLVCVLANLMDTIGSGTNIILAVSIVWQYFELFTKENMKNGNIGFVEVWIGGGVDKSGIDMKGDRDKRGIGKKGFIK